MAKYREAIGLDVGARSIKMVHLLLKGKSVSIVDYIIKEVEQDKEKSLVISEILKNAKSTKKTIPIIASIEGGSIFIRVFKLPGVRKSKLAKIVAYEAQQQVPFPIDSVTWAYQCLRRISPEEMDVVLAAVRTNVVNDFLNSLKIDITDIVPPVIGLNNFLSWSGYQKIQDAGGQAVMVLDIGARTTNVVVIEKQNLWFRTIPVGGEVITQAITVEYNISYSEAELLKKEKGEIVLETDININPDKKRISTCIIKALTRLTSEISRSIEVYSSNFNSLGPKKIFITGGGSRLKNVEEFLSKKFRVDIISFTISDILIKKDIPKDAPLLGTALGLALQGLGFGKIILSLLPKQISQKHRWLNRQAYISALSGILIFLGVCFSGYNMQMARIYKADTNRIGSEKNALDFSKKQIINIQNELDKVVNRMAEVNKVRSARIFWLDMLLELEGLLPANVWLIGIEPVGQEEKEKQKEKKEILPSYAENASGIIDLEISGKTTGAYQDAVAFRDALNNSGYFVSGTSEVISANPPADGVRDFLIRVKAKVFQVSPDRQE